MIAAFVIGSVGTCFGALLMCIMITASRASREEERRAIDKADNARYGDPSKWSGWDHTVEHVNAPETRRPDK